VDFKCLNIIYILYVIYYIYICIYRHILHLKSLGFTFLEWLAIIDKLLFKSKTNVLIWGMAQWLISVRCLDWALCLYSIWTHLPLRSALYLEFLSSSVLPEHFARDMWMPCPVLPCVLFIYHYVLPDPPEISQGLLFISVFFTVPCAAPDLMWWYSVFLNQSLRPKVWYLRYTETF
jgi:hypothetical protein